MAKNLEISARFTEMLEFLELKPAQFSKLLGYDRPQTVYDIKSGSTNPSSDFFFRFINAGFSEKINIEWLIAGKDPMKMADKKKEEPDTTVHPSLLMEYLREKDQDIKEMAEEIGSLKARLTTLQRRYHPGESDNMHVAEP